MSSECLEFITGIGEGLPEVVSIGRSIFDPVWAEKEHVDTSSELVHFLHGRGDVQTSQYTVSGQTGDTIYIPAGTPHRDVFDLDSRFEVYLVRFNWVREKELLERFQPLQLANTPEQGKRRIVLEFQSMFHDFAAHLPFGHQLTCINVLRIISIMCREAVSVQPADENVHDDLSKPRRVQIMMQIRRIIQENFNKPISLAQIACKLNISPYYVSRVFSEESAFRLSTYLTQVRMEKAVELLDQPTMNISDVAHSVGFTDSHYFGQVFKAQFGISPKAYREKLLMSSNLES